MQKDIELLEKIMSLKTRASLHDNYFCWLYPFTNENLKGYYSKLDFKNKKVLTVTSSGDHLLNALLLGAESIDAFDTNILAKYYVELKIAAIKSLPIDEFLLFLYNRSLFKVSKYYLNKNTYLNLREHLSKEYKEFWDYVFKKYTPKELYKSFLFTDDFLNIKGLIKSNMYLNEKSYNILKTILNENKITYHDLSLKDLKNINKPFDLILLSNIPAFLDRIYESEYLKNLKILIDQITTENTKVVVSYLYSNLIENNYENNIYNEKSLIKYFPKNEYEYLSFESVETLEFDSKVKILIPKKDKVLISKNIKN